MYKSACAPTTTRTSLWLCVCVSWCLSASLFLRPVSISFCACASVPVCVCVCVYVSSSLCACVRLLLRGIHPLLKPPLCDQMWSGTWFWDWLDGWARYTRVCSSYSTPIYGNLHLGEWSSSIHDPNESFPVDLTRFDPLGEAEALQRHAEARQIHHKPSRSAPGAGDAVIRRDRKQWKCCEWPRTFGENKIYRRSKIDSDSGIIWNNEQ